MSLRVSGEFWDQIKQTLVTDSFWQLPRYIIVILEAFLPKTRWRVDLFSFSWSCFWIWKPNIEQKVCFVFVAIVDRCIIVGLIVGSSRARQHTSSCVWNRARLFINNPPPYKAPAWRVETKMDSQRSEDTWCNDGTSVSRTWWCWWNNQTFRDFYMSVCRTILNWAAAAVGGALTALLLGGFHS